MARIVSFAPGGRQTLRMQPTEVICRYSAAIVGTVKIVQLDTAGSKDREFPNKVSQSLQLDAAQAATLIAILRAEFDLDLT